MDENEFARLPVEYQKQLLAKRKPIMNEKILVVIAMLIVCFAAIMYVVAAVKSVPVQSTEVRVIHSYSEGYAKGYAAGKAQGLEDAQSYYANAEIIP